MKLKESTDNKHEADAENTSPVKPIKIKKKKLVKKEEISTDKAERIAEVLKKPRTRSVSLTLSENGIDDTTDEAAETKTKPKSVKTKKKKAGAEIPPAIAEAAPPAGDGVPPEHADGRFSNFPIRQKTISKLEAKGIKYLFPIQVQTFRKVLEGKDVIAKARTGTGKTLAFALPLIEKLESEKSKTVRGRPPRVLVLAPTRELVNQVAKDFKSLSTLSIHAFYGGVGLHPQGTALRDGIDVLVGTPGRLLDWISRGQLDTSSLEHVVLDEVDQMLDMGFAEDVENIISYSYNRGEGRANPQTLLFSATLPDWVKRTATKYMESMPPVIDLVGSTLTQAATNVTHLAIKSFWKDHATDISKIIQLYSGDTGRAMVFCSTKKDVDSLAMCTEIKQNKEKLHGDVKQASRENVLEQFRQGKVKVLVTTNVAARGLDIPEVDLVIQTSPPTDIESYIHRSGRTGRAGKSGVSICLYSNRTEQDLIRVERFAKLSFKRVGVPSSEQLASRGVKELTSSIDEVDKEVLARFKDAAEELIRDRGAVDTVAALIALSTGQTKLSTCSLIDSREGFVTLHYTTNADIRFKGYIHSVIKGRVGDARENLLKNMTLTADRKGAVFDISTEDLAKLESALLFQGTNDSLVRASTLPELQPNVGSSFSNTSSPRGGWRSGGGGFSGRGGGFASRGGFKRPFQHQNYSNGNTGNKRTKFD